MWDCEMIVVNPVLTHAIPLRAIDLGHEPHKGERSSRGGRRRAGCQRASTRVSGHRCLHGKLGPVLRAGGERKTIKSREGAAVRAKCVFWRDSEVWWREGRSSRILSIYEAPLANNSTNKQREPPLLAFVDKKKRRPT